MPWMCWSSFSPMLTWSWVFAAGQGALPSPQHTPTVLKAAGLIWDKSQHWLLEDLCRRASCQGREAPASPEHCRRGRRRSHRRPSLPVLRLVGMAQILLPFFPWHHNSQWGQCFPGLGWSGKPLIQTKKAKPRLWRACQTHQASAALCWPHCECPHQPALLGSLPCTCHLCSTLHSQQNLSKLRENTISPIFQLKKPIHLLGS